MTSDAAITTRAGATSVTTAAVGGCPEVVSGIRANTNTNTNGARAPRSLYGAQGASLWLVGRYRDRTGDLSGVNAARLVVLMLARLVQDAAGTGLRFHDLRHSSATWLVDDGVPPNMVQRVMGHESVPTTLRLYTRRTANHDRILDALGGAAIDPENDNPENDEDGSAGVLVGAR